ncbi:tryptophan N-monooxygenase CYP79A68-like [Salvia miltiorrhiza]|uniref:tryptophan N-monooxygenase CYP79A68-like n=1 Tax=Salvia miltiorrhiza TaxID=226208 RepID=UPI0025AC9C61|nr:tryptophan N-monooxygenase CYP79A68-like [Salvia miltiorrhiza]
MELVLLLLVALGFALTIIFHKSTPRINKSPKHPLPPGPTGYPIVGCLPEMARNKPTFRWMLNYMQSFNTEIACFRLGGVHVIAITSPELAREFFNEQDAVFAARPGNMTGRLTSGGYLSAVLAPGGDQWKKMRRVIVSEVLAAAVHDLLHGKRCEEADHLVRYVYNQCRESGAAVNVREAARLYCGGVIRKLVFGKRFFGPGTEDGGPGFEEREHMDAVWIILSYTYGFAIADYVPFLEMFDFDGHKKILTNAIKNLRKYQDPEIDHRVEMWRNGGRSTNDDILDVLINLKDSNDHPLLSIEEIKAQVIEMSIAVIDNPSNVAEWSMREMIREPRILDVAVKELDEVVGKKRLVQESDLPQLNYIKACVKEAIRLHPVAPFNLPHVSTEDTVVSGYFIPKGSHILLSRLGLGRNPRVWDYPLRFKPERHIDGSSHVGLTDSKLRMWSFGVGKRGCPAILLGSTIMTMLLARLVQSFSWKSPSHMPSIEDSNEDPFLADPLVARATPRLEPQVYKQLM